MISHDRFFLDRICAHMLAFEGEGHVEWFEGNFEDYEPDKIRRLDPDAAEPKHIKYKKFSRCSPPYNDRLFLRLPPICPCSDEVFQS